MFLFKKFSRNFSEIKSKLKEISLTGESTGHGLVTAVFNSKKQIVKESSPLELLLYSLISCENDTFRYIAKTNNVNIGKINFTKVEALYDVKGFLGLDSDNRFKEINIQMKIETNEEFEKIQNLLNKVKKQCPIYWMISKSGVPINTEFSISKIN